jgi:purine-nucleoside phosphorylase
VVLGSGLDGALPELEGRVEIPWKEVPGWPGAGVPGHRGVLVAGRRGDRGVLVQLGRLHYYEGLDMDEVVFPVGVMASLGLKRVFMSNAAGALNPAYRRGMIMLVRDHINLMGVNPLRGWKEGGEPAFLDLSDLYDPVRGDALMERSRSEGWPLDEGVLVAVAGPAYETPAELRFLRLIGGDAVSMSMVPEAVTARYLDLEITAVSVITNVWDLRRPLPLTHEEVLDAARSSSPVLREIITFWMDLD